MIPKYKRKPIAKYIQKSSSEYFMKWFKLWCHICALLKYILFKILYRNQISFGKHVTWRKRFSILLDKNAKLEIGDDCFFNNDCSINVIKSIKIGKGTIFGEGVKIYDHNHRFNDLQKSIKEQGFISDEITIGAHCWIGSNVVILKGTKISDNCVIGAAVVVRGFVEPNTIIKQNDYAIEKIGIRNQK